MFRIWKELIIFTSIVYELNRPNLIRCHLEDTDSEYVDKIKTPFVVTITMDVLIVDSMLGNIAFCSYYVV
jgi:hypothetical protein